MSQSPVIQTTKVHKLSDQVAFYAHDKRAEIVAFAGSDDRADKFIADMKMLCVDKNLQGCAPLSIFMSSLNALQLRLSIVKQSGQAYVLPFKEDGVPQAQLQIGYKGWQLICKRAAYSVDCELVFDCDEFDLSMDEAGKKIRFRPNMKERDPEDGKWCDKHMIGAVVWVTDENGTQPRFVTGKKLRYIRSKSKAPNSPAWRDWTEEMYKGKAIKYVASKLPSDNEELHKAVALDNEGMNFELERGKPKFSLIPDMPGLEQGAGSGEVLPMPSEKEKETVPVPKETQNNAVERITEDLQCSMLNRSVSLEYCNTDCPNPGECSAYKEATT